MIALIITEILLIKIALKELTGKNIYPNKLNLQKFHLK